MTSWERGRWAHTDAGVAPWGRRSPFLPARGHGPGRIRGCALQQLRVGHDTKTARPGGKNPSSEQENSELPAPLSLHPGDIRTFVRRAKKPTRRKSAMEVRVQLKVCEGCGCLWFRSQMEESVYCGGCATRLREFPSPQTRKRPGRRPHQAAVARIWAVAAADGGVQ